MNDIPKYIKLKNGYSILGINSDVIYAVEELVDGYYIIKNTLTNSKVVITNDELKEKFSWITTY